jgi:CelD/BcsL family acetyltransferase involved in cellulose biosynthesis
LTSNSAVKLSEKATSTSVEFASQKKLGEQLLPRIELVTSIADLRAIEVQWRLLEAENVGRSTVFQSFDWCVAWCEAYLHIGNVTELIILTGYQNSKLNFIMPLGKSKRHGIQIVDWLTDPIGQYGDILCAKTQNPKFWLNAAFKHLAKMTGIDLVRLRHVRETSNVAEFAKTEMLDAKYDERAPYLDLSLYKSEAEYDARYTSTQRKRRKKIRKSLEDIGPVVFETITAGAATDKAIDDAIVEKNAWLSERGRFNRIMGCPDHLTFLKNLSRSPSPHFKMITTQLKTGDKPASWEIAFRYQGTHFAYVTSHVNALTNLSPGRLHMDLSQRLALADGQTAFDLMVPYDLHKDSWSSGTIPTNDYFKPMSFKGSVYGLTYLRTLRPIVRKLYYKLPPTALRMLQPFTR